MSKFSQADIAASNKANDVKFSIKLIDFESFRKVGRFPRSPDDQQLATKLGNINRDESFIIYVSHNWYTGDDYDAGSLHPDNIACDKYKLCVEGIDKIMKSFAPLMKKCFIWIDYFSLNQVFCSYSIFKLRL
jgi:hypothetical protein